MMRRRGGGEEGTEQRPWLETTHAPVSVWMERSGCEWLVLYGGCLQRGDKSLMNQGQQQAKAAHDFQSLRALFTFVALLSSASFLLLLILLFIISICRVKQWLFRRYVSNFVWCADIVCPPFFRHFHHPSSQPSAALLSSTSNQQQKAKSSLFLATVLTSFFAQPFSQVSHRTTQLAKAAIAVKRTQGRAPAFAHPHRVRVVDRHPRRIPLPCHLMRVFVCRGKWRL